MRPGRNKFVLANRQDARHAMFQVCHCYGLTETSLFLPIARKPSCNGPIVSLLRLRMNKPVLANRQNAFVQCSDCAKCVIATTSHCQTSSCQSPESPSCNVPIVSLLGLARKSFFFPIPRQPSCNVPIVSLLRPRKNKPVLANRQTALVQCSNCVIAMASHKQACSCAMFQLCHCYGLAESNLFLRIARKPSCNVPIVSLLRPRMNKTVLANRQKVLVQCSNCVIAMASH